MYRFLRTTLIINFLKKFKNRLLYIVVALSMMLISSFVVDDIIRVSHFDEMTEIVLYKWLLNFTLLFVIAYQITKIITSNYIDLFEYGEDTKKTKIVNSENSIYLSKSIITNIKIKQEKSCLISKEEVIDKEDEYSNERTSTNNNEKLKAKVSLCTNPQNIMAKYKRKTPL